MVSLEGTDPPSKKLARLPWCPPFRFRGLYGYRDGLLANLEEEKYPRYLNSKETLGDISGFSLLRTCAQSHPFYFWGVAPLTPDNKWWKNVLTSFRNRLNVAPLTVSRRAYRAMTAVGMRLGKYCSRGYKVLPRRTWVKSKRNYPLPRREELLRACDRLWVRLIVRAMAFIKKEFYFAIKHPRMINSRHDTFKVLCGPYFSAIEKQLMRKKSFIKYCPASARPQYVRDRLGSCSYIYGVDGTRFESCVTARLMRATEFQVYKHFGVPKRILDVLCGEGKSTFYGPNGAVVRAYRTAPRFSGEMNTSLGNAIVNYCMCKGIARVHGCTFKLIIEGDDVLIGSDLPIQQDWWDEFGLRAVLTGPGEPGELGFCSMYWSRSLELVAPLRRLIKIGWSATVPASAGRAVRDERFAATAMCLSYEMPNAPILWAISHKYAGQGRIKWTWWLEQKLLTNNVPHHIKGGLIHITAMNHKSAPPCTETRAFYEYKFGISITTQLALERQILEGNRCPYDPSFIDCVASLYPDCVLSWETYTH